MLHLDNEETFSEPEKGTLPLGTWSFCSLAPSVAAGITDSSGQVVFPNSVLLTHFAQIFH